jgi:acetyltransferase-like isoleucine patch superfamily enzyme
VDKHADIVKHCLNCHSEFIVAYKHRNRKFCSQKCNGEFQRGKKRPQTSLALKKVHDTNPEAWPRHPSWNKGKTGCYSKETIGRMSKAKQGKPSWNKGIHVSLSPQTEFTSERLKELWQNPVFRNNTRLGWIKSAYKHPNKTEKQLLDLIKVAQLPFEYNDSLVIEGLTPDFVSTDNSRRIVELFGEPFHSDDVPFVDFKRCYWGRKAIFKSHNFDAHIIWYRDFITDPLFALDTISSWLCTNFSKVGSNPRIHPGAKLANVSNLELGAEVTIMAHTFVNAGNQTSIGARSQINAGAILAGGGVVEIGEDVTIGYGALLLSGTDSPEGRFMNDLQAISQRAVRRGKIIIGDRAFIGSKAVISMNKEGIVEIGAGAVIGSGCYIDKNIGPNLIIHPTVQYDVRKRK